MTYRFMATLCLTAFIFSVPAGAAEVTRSVEVNGKAADVWAKVGGWCAVADWHPVVAKCEEAEAGDKKTRTLTTGDGAVIKETMLESGDTTYSYRIDESPLPVENYTANLAVEGDGEQARIVWTANFDPKGDEAEAVAVIQGIFDGGLAEIKKSFE
ncbi:MAG: SRPBCC family protein [Oricola sp.]